VHVEIGRRLHTERAQHRRRAAVHEPDERIREPIRQVERIRRPERDPERTLDREVLGGELAEDDGDIGHEAEGDQEREDVERRLRCVA
jgi:hypothetical protein